MTEVKERSALAVYKNDPENIDPDNIDPGNDDASARTPVRLTMGNYYCANCGEDGLSRSDPRCPSCQDYLRWDNVAV